MYERLFKSRKSSAIALGVLLICILLVFLDKASLTEVSIAAPVILYFLFKKDVSKPDNSDDYKPIK